MEACRILALSLTDCAVPLNGEQQFLQQGYYSGILSAIDNESVKN